MANTKTAKKELRKSARKHVRNVAKKRNLKDTLKTYEKLIASKKLDDAKKQLAAVYKKLDKAAKNGLIKKNKASRTKSRLTKVLAKASAKS